MKKIPKYLLFILCLGFICTTISFAQPSAKGGEQQSVVAATDPCPRPYGSATFTKVDATCNGTSTGSITILPTVGLVSDYTYKLHYSDPYVASNVFTNLKSGIYHGYALRTGGCVFRAGLITINNTNTKLGATTTHTDVSTKGGSDGTITVAGTGGTGNYMYQLGSSGTPQSSDSFKGLSAGTYRLIVTDVAGCKPDFGTSVTIAQPAAKGGEKESIDSSLQSNGLLKPIESLQIVVTEASCDGVSDGVIILDPQHLINNAVYSLPATHSLGSGARGNIWTGLRDGEYNGFAYDQSTGKTYSHHKIVVKNSANLTLAPLAKTDVTVIGGYNGTITALASGGSGQYFYELHENGRQPSPGYFTNLYHGKYHVSVSDSKGCNPVAQTIYVNQPPYPGPINQHLKEPTSAKSEPALSQDKKITIYPNPATDRFTLQLSNYKPGKAEIVMTNESGQIVERRSIDITSLQSNTVFGKDKKASGTYFVKVITAEGVQVSKVMIQDK